MSKSPGSVLQYVRHLWQRSATGVTDGQLLQRFVDNRDEAAFELLLWRHQRMVFSVCRRVLHNVHDAEDAFQATFLVLARKAGSIRQQASLASWLHQVALRVALRLRTSSSRRAQQEISSDHLLDGIVSVSTELDRERSIPVESVGHSTYPH